MNELKKNKKLNEKYRVLDKLSIDEIEKKFGSNFNPLLADLL